LRLSGPEQPRTVSTRNALAEWEALAASSAERPVVLDLTTAEAAPSA
jgi:hypothetical protein